MTEPEDENENVELGYNVETRSAVLEFRESEEDGYLEGIAVPMGRLPTSVASSRSALKLAP
jgi:hypothetical protein